MSAFDAFIGGYSRSQSPIADAGLLQNLYVQRMAGQGAKNDKVLYPTPGMVAFGSVAQVGGKRFFSTAASDSRVFSITGSKLYEWFSDGSALERGVVAVDANPAVIFTNGKGGQQLAICAGGNFYSYDLVANTLTAVAFLTGKATQCGFISGYFLVFDITTGTVYQSDLYDGTTFDPLNFFQRNVQADDWNAMYVMSWGQIFLPGTKTRDTYYNAGTFPIPFAPSQSGIRTQGSVATFSVAEIGDQICWLGTAGQAGGYKVYTAQGYEAITISTEAIDYALSRFTQSEIANATGEGYNDQGHDFYLLYVGTTTFCFSFQSGEWHTRRTFMTATSGVLGAWRAKWHCFGFNKHLWLDSDTGYAYQSDISFPSDVDSLPIQRSRTSPSICRNKQMLDIGEIELICQVGIGNTNDPGANPLCWLEISYDGGQTWGRQRSAPLGRQGQYDLRVRWNANGSGRDIAFRLSMTDAVVGIAWISFLCEMFQDERGRPINLGSQQAA